MIISIEAERIFEKIPAVVHDKNTQETRKRKQILQNDKGHIQKLHR